MAPASFLLAPADGLLTKSSVKVASATSALRLRTMVMARH